MRLVQFGGGNIGRSFIGQLFARSGYEVVFVDIDDALVDALNREHRYRVIVKRNDAPDETVWVENVRGVRASERSVIAAEIADTDLIATSVGKNALPHVFPALAEGIEARAGAGATAPVDIIIAENIRGGAALFRAGLGEHLPPAFSLDRQVGLVETSIGKMVPIMTDEDRARDPLWVFAEAYNTLIVDRHGFCGPVPDLPAIKAVDNINAYVDRKLFVHNLGHAAVAYFGYESNEAFTYIWEPLTDRSVVAKVTDAMREAAAALSREYPDDLTAEDLEEHIQDLLRRFANRALGDTIFRVGRDLYRKLGREDRLVGACLLAARHGLPYSSIAAAIRAAVKFRATDEHGIMYSGDRRFASQEAPKGLHRLLTEVCGLDLDIEPDSSVVRRILSGGEEETAL